MLESRVSTTHLCHPCSTLFTARDLLLSATTHYYSKIRKQPAIAYYVCHSSMDLTHPVIGSSYQQPARDRMQSKPQEATSIPTWLPVSLNHHLVFVSCVDKHPVCANHEEKSIQGHARPDQHRHTNTIGSFRILLFHAGSVEADASTVGNMAHACSS